MEPNKPQTPNNNDSLFGVTIRVLPLPPEALFGLLNPDGMTGVVAMNDGSIYKFVWNQKTQTVSLLERVHTNDQRHI